VKKVRRQGLGALLKAITLKMLHILFEDLLLGRIVGPVPYKRIIFRANIGYWPNLKDPKTFNEKVEHGRLFSTDPLIPIVNDKWRVRDYVAGKDLSHILNDNLHTTDDPATIPFDELPNGFVIKSNYGCADQHVVIVRDQRMIDRAKIIATCRKWLSPNTHRRFGFAEPKVRRIRPLIVVERLIKDRFHEGLLDYKFFMIHGEVAFVEVEQGRFARGVHTSIYNEEWNRQPFTRSKAPGEDIPRPKHLDEMLHIARVLSEDFPFTRVDLFYPEEKRIMFGEITTFPGEQAFQPTSYDGLFGSRI